MTDLKQIFINLSPVLFPVLACVIMKIILKLTHLQGIELLRLKLTTKKTLLISIPMIVISLVSIVLSIKLYSYTIYTNVELGLVFNSILYSLLVISVNIAMIPFVSPDSLKSWSSRLLFWVLGVRKSHILQYEKEIYLKSQQKRPNTSQNQFVPPRPTREQFLKDFDKSTNVVNNKDIKFK